MHGLRMAEKDKVMVVFNLTRNPINAYNADGDIITLYPVQDAFKLLTTFTGIAAFVVSDTFYENATGLKKKFIGEYVHIVDTGAGNSGVEVSRFETFRSIRGKNIRVIPTHLDTYKEIDPTNKTYESVTI